MNNNWLAKKRKQDQGSFTLSEDLRIAKRKVTSNIRRQIKTLGSETLDKQDHRGGPSLRPQHSQKINLANIIKTCYHWTITLERLSQPIMGIQYKWFKAATKVTLSSSSWWAWVRPNDSWKMLRLILRQDVTNFRAFSSSSSHRGASSQSHNTFQLKSGEQYIPNTMEMFQHKRYMER